MLMMCQREWHGGPDSGNQHLSSSLGTCSQLHGRGQSGPTFLNCMIQAVPQHGQVGLCFMR